MFDLVMGVINLTKQNQQRAQQIYMQTIQRGLAAHNAMEEMSAGTRQLSNVTNGRILGSLDVAANQRAAEANELINAAVHGVEGTTVNQVKAQQDFNAAKATNQMNSYFSQQYEVALDRIETGSFTLSSNFAEPFQGSDFKFLKEMVVVNS